MRLTNDLDPNQTRKILEVLRDETSIFQGYSHDDVVSLSQVFKVLTFKRNDYIAKRNEEIDFFGIFLHGQAFVSLDLQKIKTMSIGDMIGFMCVSELQVARDNTKHKYDIIAETDGILACLPFGEIKSESRKYPQVCFKILQIAAKKSLEVFHYNVFGHEYNPAIKHVNTAGAAKKVREFFLKNPLMRAFLKGIDRKDEKYIMNSLKTTEMDPGDRLVRKGTKDRAIIFVAQGQFMAFKDTENEVYKEGAVLGVKEFLRGDEWPNDIICSQTGYICKFTHEALIDMTQTAPISAIRMLRRIIRHQCYDYIYQKKMSEKRSFEFFQVEDDDLFIDLKLNYQNEKERELAKLFNKPPPEMKKGREFDSMPFFLSDEFKHIMEDKHQKANLQKLTTSNVGKDKLAGSGNMGGISSISGPGMPGNSMYKSEFLKERLHEQNEKRKRERKLKKVQPSRIATDPSTNGKAPIRRKEGQEDLEEVIDEMRNDLRIREQEYEELREAFAKLELENKRLRDQVKKETSERQVIEVKLKKNAIHTELKDNASSINGNTFFEQKRSKLASLNSTLLSTINEQYKSGLRNSYVAKYAHRWLQIVRERKKLRERDSFFKF
ncbi:UNKNOWN [Stylonychia lemnae]|uniref:Cyclic nucleotide-binding domain-containing protein n=1 Tax=Stylonychia lemnae TaxID=5949 RepID=A0A078AS98_STYLE|nr:UNKNOWN [Stylonychia lemnae]|eukprot:CDW84841.1 UNKNOWN [Stylonychia lemnae]